MNPFETNTGSDKLSSPGFLFLVITLVFISGWLIGHMGLMAGIVLLGLPFAILFLAYFFHHPILGMYTTLILGFLILGSVRYIKGVQVGMAMDGILFLTYIVLIFNRFKERVNWKPAKKDITILSFLWFAYSLAELINPEMRSFQAWLAGMRGISLYMVLLIPLVLLFVDSKEKIRNIFIVWGVMSLLATFKGLMQLTIGVDPWEKAWLEGGGAITHVIFGKLRIFSFMSDAGQFGANQAYSGVVFLILFFFEKKRRFKLFYLAVALLGFYGMFISGTRGAIAVPLAGFMLYFILKKNKAVMFAGVVMLAAVFVFFKYTLIGQDNQQIRRMRSAFDPNDASLQVRLENQKKLRVYLATRPMGGSIGHAGVKAQKYLPNTFLSNVATDSWYVLIWAEQGIIGLILHMFILFYVILKSSYWVMYRIRDPEIKTIMAALTSGMFGIMAASYGNAVLGTMPTGILIYISMALMMNAGMFNDKYASPDQHKLPSA